MLSTHDLVLSYAPGAPALGPVSTAFPAGKLSVLLGPSGAGKTSLLRCLAHFATPSGGTVRVAGQALDATGLRAFRRACGVVFQDPRLVPRWSAARNVLLGARRAHTALRSLLPCSTPERRTALAALADVGLLELADRRVDRLSGGERQRVELARALAWSPTVVLADEPIANLDPGTGRRILELLRARCATGTTVIASLHQADLALAVADHVVVLDRGRVAWSGAPADLDPSLLSAVYSAHHAQEPHDAPAAARLLPDLHPLPFAGGARR